MGSSNILWTFIAIDFVFLLSGGLILAFALVSEDDISTGITSEADTTARNILLTRCPLGAGAANAALIFFTFVVSLPAMILPTSRGWLKFHGYLIFACSIFTLVLGLSIWFDTLTTRTRLLEVWTAQSTVAQSTLQQSLKCCGYFNSTTPLFITDSFCTSAAIAATKVGCVGPFSVYANNFLDVVFTAAFGIVGIDVVLILAVACLLKDRKEQERYRFIDEKQGSGGF